MVAITLPDGSVRNFDGPVTGAALAAGIGPGLAKAALAVKVNGELRDLSRTIETDAGVEIVTRDHEDALELLRHDAAHVFAEAVQELYPGTQITFGPAIEDGFYYDFDRPEAFQDKDLRRIKKEMEDDFKKKKVVEEEKQSELRQRGLEERKKNDEYSEWLAVDHVRTSLEQVNTRADPSKMHEGGKFRGSPTDFTPGQ